MSITGCNYFAVLDKAMSSISRKLILRVEIQVLLRNSEDFKCQQKNNDQNQINLMEIKIDKILGVDTQVF